ncbi:hypothetical protein CVT26_004046 [Gymnopilus dilepis]|uniref:Uncharacterized protein n=1 Tax=Gymnopilus dilepis TaxID=231916 RepID=A0A409YNV7_9AGAR|nr:hypothetical protein CVT26_004046 [Gymnopilus dilepis]
MTTTPVRLEGWNTYSLDAMIKSRKLPAHVKEHRRRERRAEQAAVEAKRAGVIARMENLARSFAPNQEEALSKVNWSNRSHIWSVEICLGKGKFFDDIGRWYRMCSAELHIGLKCQKANFISGKLSDAQIFELTKLWALHDSIENRMGKTKRYRRASYGSPPAALMVAKPVAAAFESQLSTFDIENGSYASVDSLAHLQSFPTQTSLSSPPRHMEGKKVPIPYPSSTAGFSNVSSSLVTPCSSDDEVPPVHVAFKDLLARSRQRKSAMGVQRSTDVIEISSDSECEIPIVKGKSKPEELRNDITCNRCLDVIEIFSDSDG